MLWALLPLFPMMTNIGNDNDDTNNDDGDNIYDDANNINDDNDDDVLLLWVLLPLFLLL